ncbi:MAG TPA: proprotein convertase P-domain-containing protein [Thermoanaerobaculia bacterium]|jgi:subtilisin-like proprotein convertase family protein
MLLAAALVFELARESLTGTHCRYREYVNGYPTDTYVTMQCGGPEAAAFPSAGNLRWSAGRLIRREIRDLYQHDYDATTGALISRTPLFFHAKPARVFDPNPVVTLNDPNLQDLNDASAHIPATAYVDVQLPDEALHGPHVTIVDRQPRFVAPAEGALVFDRTADGFEDVNAYFHIDRTQNHLRALGYTGARAIAPYAIEVDAHAANGDDNSFFIPSSAQPGRGTLFYGEGGTDDAEDADLVVHEYTHALMEWISPGTWGGSFGSESRAIAEAVSDYFAFSAHYDARKRSGRDPFCFADWDARCWLDATSERCGYAPGSDCLRRLDSPRTMADYSRGDSSGVEHLNSAILSSALRELRVQLDRHTVDVLVLESLYGAPPRPTFESMARRIIEVDRILYNGAHVMAICAAMRARGILAECEVMPRGELTHFQSPRHGVAIPDNDANGIASTLRIDDTRAIENIYVRVDVAHPTNGDLRLELVAPDGTRVLLQNTSGSLASDIHATYGITATPAQPLDVLRGRSAHGVWTLLVSDRSFRDAGTLLWWGLEIQFAGEAPRTARPRGERTQMIPVVAHLFGQSGLFASDVRIANPHATARTATLILTPSGSNGLERFGAVQLVLEAGQTLAFDDVVSSVFHSGGSGSLEILGDVIAMSRTYLRTANGTLGQDVPPNLDATSASEPPLFVAPLTETGARYNFGLTEIAGGRAIVRVGDRTISIEPFSHVQFPVAPSLLAVRVLSGNARVVAYLSQLVRDDAMFIPAQRIETVRTRFAPAITAQTSDPPEWRSDLWIDTHTPMRVRIDALGGGSVDADAPGVFSDVLARLFHRTVTVAALRAHLPAGVFAATRIVHNDTMQFVPLLDAGPSEQHLLFLANAGQHRVNAGIVTDTGAAAELLVYDAAGVQLERVTFGTNAGFVQRAVPPGARAVVRFVIGTGRAYASVIDVRTGDATFIAGQE